VTLVKSILARAEARDPAYRPRLDRFLRPKSFTPFQWSPFDGVETLERKLAYLKERFRSVKGAKLKWHAPKEAEIEALLSLATADGEGPPRSLEARRTVRRLVGAFLVERWNEALAAAGVPKERHLRPKDLKETLPWDVVDAFIRKPFLVVEWKKALQEGGTEDCKWGHCTACGVPGNGEDTVLATPLPEDFSFGGRPAYRSRARAGRAGRSRRVPDEATRTSPLRNAEGGDAPPCGAETARTYRVSFEKLGDASTCRTGTSWTSSSALSRRPRPIRYTEGYNRTSGCRWTGPSSARSRDTSCSTSICSTL